MTAFRDQDGYRLIAGLLEDTGQFAAVLSGLNPASLATTGNQLPRAWLKPAGWKESSDVDPEEAVRAVSYRLEITVDRADGTDPTDELDRLGNVAADALAGVSLGGATLPRLSIVSEGRYPDAPGDHPSQSLILMCQFAYLVAGDSGRGDDSTPWSTAL